MKSASVLLLATIAVGTLAAPATRHNYVLHERRDVLSSVWQDAKRLDKKALLPMRIGLTQRNLDRGYELLMEVSSHKSPRYGKHYTVEEVHDIFSPSQESVDAVRTWLESAGIVPERVSLSANKQWLQFDADTEEVENLLQTKYYVYSHSKTGKSHVATDEYYVPETIREHIDYITPGIKLLEVSGAKPSQIEKRTFGFKDPQPPLMHPLDVPMSSLTGNPLGLCDKYAFPACIKALYNITEGTTAHPGNELGIFEDLGDVYAQEDLNAFFWNFYPQIPNGTHPVGDLIDGAVAPVPDNQAGAESDLDFQISYPIIWPQNSVLFQTDDPYYENNYVFQGFLNNFFDAIDGSYCSYKAYGEKGNSPLDPSYPDPNPGGYKGQLQCGVYRPTNVISISYGGAESDLPISYQRRQCNEIMKLGLQGISVLVSSGDSGVAGRGGDPTPSNCLGVDHKVFAPQFPATCPYITAVGATYLPPGANVSKDQEIAVTRFPSGGGFSNIYGRAWYQQDAVRDYFAISDPGYPYYSSIDNSSFADNGGIYNRIGRAYPDVAAIGDNVVIVYRDQPVLIGGTSASSPTFAAILTRINEERLARGMSTVGFVNPILYAHPEVFHDITVGSNPGCGTNGFSCAKGWDPVTGLGTPDYPKLLELFLRNGKGDGNDQGHQHHGKGDGNGQGQNNNQQ